MSPLHNAEYFSWTHSPSDKCPVVIGVTKFFWMLTGYDVAKHANKQTNATENITFLAKVVKKKTYSYLSLATQSCFQPYISISKKK